MAVPLFENVRHIREAANAPWFFVRSKDVANALDDDIEGDAAVEHGLEHHLVAPLRAIGVVVHGHLHGPIDLGVGVPRLDGRLGWQNTTVRIGRSSGSSRHSEARIRSGPT